MRAIGTLLSKELIDNIVIMQVRAALYFLPIGIVLAPFGVWKIIELIKDKLS